MRIAVLNSWPNLKYSAEREFIARLKLTCLNLGWECIEVITSEELINASVDCVIVTHEFSAKLTDIPTIGLLWSPPDFYRDDPSRTRSILSYDGYFAGSDSVREYLQDLLFSTEKNSPISDWNFLPTAPQAKFRPPNLNEPTLFYAGVHWDGDRHKELIEGLCARVPVAFYGDPTKWERYGKFYKGAIPFDGVSIFNRINEAGVALCLHRDEHLKHDVPSMRIFESAAAGAVIITENSNFAKRNFGESVLYVDQNADVAEKVSQIADHFAWIRSHPNEALELAVKSNAIFNERFSLEKMLINLPDFLEKLKTAGHYNVCVNNQNLPKVEVIVRIGGRSLFFIERCLDSLAAQSHKNLGLILVSYKDVSGLDALLDKYKTRFVSIKRIASQPTGFRSTSLWDGIRVVDAEYFCNQDDDDTLHSNHISSLVDLLESKSDFHVAYSGCVQVQDEPGHYYKQINFSGPIGAEIKENRHLVFFDQFQRQRILRFDNFVQSNTWLARRSLLRDRDLIDPKLIVAEDMYLYFLFLRKGDFLFSWNVTANWHWRSTSMDNSMLNETCWQQCGERVKLRTRFFALSNNANVGNETAFLGDGRVALTCKDVLRPFVVYARDIFYRIPFFKKSSKSQVTTIYNPPHGASELRYQATLSEGIIFNKDGYPTFVSKVTGFSEKEQFGRWTDGYAASIEFTQPLPEKFNLKIKASVFIHMVDKIIPIIIGNTQVETKFDSDKVTEILIPVVTDGNAKSIFFKFPDAKSPSELGGTSDTRKLGLAMIHLQIE